MTPAETPVDPYPMLTRLCNDLFEIRAERRTGGLVLCFDPNFNPGCVEFTPAEVLALADELRRMAQTQEPA